jgi:hypothetical protein
MYHNLVSPHPLFHEDLLFREDFLTETVTVTPLIPPEWAANIPGPFPQLCAWQPPEFLETAFLVSSSQVNGSSEPNGSSTHAIQRPLSAGIDRPNTTESRQHYSQAGTEHSNFIEDSFPLSSDGHCDLRRALSRVMTASWKLHNVLEPRQGTLLDFLKYETDAKRWFCCFWIKGAPCRCSFSKKDQAKNHIRFHIEHLPFSCSSRGIW